MRREEAELGELTEIFDSFDEGRCFKWRHYLPLYERYLERFRGTDCSYLEIGVFRGGSLDLFKRYLGEQAKIYGVDIDPACRAAVEHNGHRFFLADQSKPDQLQAVVRETGPVDIIVDDGGHTADQQITTFVTLFPFLKNGGVYVVEDLHTSFWLDYQRSRLGINFYDYAKGMVDKLSLWHMDREIARRYQQPYEERQGRLVMENFVPMLISGIHFHDSMIVFEKNAVGEPINQLK